MIKAEIDREINRVKVEATGKADDLEAELIAIILYMKREKIFNYTAIREMIKAASRSEKLEASDLIISDEH